MKNKKQPRTVEQICNESPEGFQLYLLDKTNVVYCGLKPTENTIKCSNRAKISDKNGLYVCNYGPAQKVREADNSYIN